MINIAGKNIPAALTFTGTTIALPRREEPTIIQQEGWLWKRGAGFKQSQDHHHPIGSAGSSTEEDVIRRSSALRLATAPNAIASLLHGKDEKKRYFMLLTTPAANARKQSKDDKDGPIAEIRYWKRRPETEVERALPRGSIVLTADMDVTLEDNIILVYAPGRTYYLRTDVPENQMARAKTSASQWINAIRFALNGLRAYELQGAVGLGTTPHPLQNHRSIRISAVISGLNEQRQAARRSFTDKSSPKMGTVSEVNADGLAEDVCAFAELWHVEGIDAYDRVVAHFGPALTDLSRLRDHYNSRISQIDSELAILDQEMGHSAEVVVKEQRTIADAMKELHRSSQRHSSALKEAAKDVKNRVIATIDAAMREISSKLENIVRQSSTAASYVEGAKKALVEAVEKVEKLQEALDAVSSGQVSGGAPTTRTKLRRKSEGVPLDPNKIEADLSEARQQRRDASQTLVTTETKQAEIISKAMDELYKLEKIRLERLVACLEAAADIEMRLNEKMTSEAESMAGSLEHIDGPKDIRATFARLKAAAEKTREKPRRKNSLYARVDFSRLTEE